MSWWNAKYTNGNGDNEITFGSKYYERAKAVEKVCQAVIDKKVKTPDDVAVVVRCKDCKHGELYARNDGETGVYCNCSNSIFKYANEHTFTPVRDIDDFCSYGERKDEADAKG